jgi:hypothetical protein
MAWEDMGGTAFMRRSSHDPKAGDARSKKPSLNFSDTWKIDGCYVRQFE